MARKGEKSKARKSPDKSPRRVGRPSRRRKKSDSESSEDKKSLELAEVEQGESSESGRMRRSGRRQAEPSTSDPKPQPNEWKEDESFWSKEEEEKNKTETKQEDGATVWKVQTSNGSGGEIQKLRICRQRPGGPGSDSAESSMSPAKDSSPLHNKRALKRESQKSPLVEGNVAEIELPPTSGMISEPLDISEVSLPLNQASEEAVPEINTKPVGPKVVEYIYETQPSVVSTERNSPPQVNESGSTPAVEQDKTTSPTTELTTEESQSEKEKVEVPSPDLNMDITVVEEAKVVTQNTPIETPIENQAGEKAEEEIKVPESPENKKTEDESAPCVEDQAVADTTAVEDIPALPETPSVESELPKETDVVPEIDENKTESSNPTLFDSLRLSSNVNDSSDASAAVESRRKSDCSVKSGGSRRSSVSGPTSADNEPLLEISVNKSPMHEGKEEGEIVEDEKSESSDQRERRRVITIRSKSSEGSPPEKLNINRRSTSGESLTPSSSSKVGSAPVTPATTAKKHPLITGPEPDDSLAVRRRKLTALTTTRTVITAGGTTRPVRSIPGEALKAVLLPEAEKKDKEKRPKLVKTKEEKSETGGDELSHEAKLNMVEDVREILKNNRANDRKVIAEKESRTSTKSPSKTIPEPNVSTRKVSIAAAPLIEDVKSNKLSRSKSPGDSKASPILFITSLVRPFTAGQLKELLARTGTIVRNGFFIDKIKSKCFVKYADVEMAIETKHALNGVRWPVSNPKVLKVTFATEKELKCIQDSAEGEIVDDISTPRSSSGWLSSEQAAVKDKEKRKISGPSTREWDRGKPKSGGSDGDVIFVDEYSKDEKFKQTTLMDIERNERMRDHHEKNKIIKEEHTRNLPDRDRNRRKRRSSPLEIENSSPPPARKFKKKDYDAPAKLLDGLFRTTKTSPCLYWLPLSAEQITINEQTRKKHMAEEERKIAELKKLTLQRRDKERDRGRRRK